MKKFILLFLLLIFSTNLTNAIEYKDYTFLGSINDENNKKYNDIEIKILWKNWSHYFDKDWKECITISTDFENPDVEYETNHWTFYMNCNLPANEIFDIYFSKNWEIIKILDFTTNKDLFVVWVEEYHDIRFWVYSKDPNKFLFSDDVIEKQYDEYLPRNKYTAEEVEKYQSEKIINFEFTCNNWRLIEKYLSYEILDKNDKFVTDWLFLQFIPVSILKWEELKLIYWDWKDKKIINVNYDMQDWIEISYLLYNCDSTNSKYNSNVLIWTGDILEENIEKENNKEIDKELIKKSENNNINRYINFYYIFLLLILVPVFLYYIKKKNK